MSALHSSNKGRVRNWPVITIHIPAADKQALELQASLKGMGLATYCRMILLDSLQKKEKQP